MLRIQKEGTSRSWTGKVALLALLVLAMGIAGLRSPAQDTAKPSQSPEVTTKLSALDLRYAPPEGAGMVSLRPGTLLASPELKPLCELYDDAGRRYLDCIAAYGALPFGFNPPAVWKAWRCGPRTTIPLPIRCPTGPSSPRCPNR